MKALVSSAHSQAASSSQAAWSTMCFLARVKVPTSPPSWSLFNLQPAELNDWLLNGLNACTGYVSPVSLRRAHEQVHWGGGIEVEVEVEGRG